MFIVISVLMLFGVVWVLGEKVIRVIIIWFGVVLIGVVILVSFGVFFIY